MAAELSEPERVLPPGGDARPPAGVWRRLLRKPAAVVSLVYLALLVLAAVFAPAIAPLDPEEMYADRYHPPGGPYLLGTDNLGRDIFSRLVYGSRLSLSVGFIAVGIAVTGGTALGLLAGYFGGRVDQVIMRLVDVMLAFPGILLALVIIAILGSSLANVMIAIGIATMPTFTRLVRGSTLEVKELEYVDAARAAGAGPVKLMLRHILPNVIQPVIVMATLGMATAILSAAGLSFIGLGAPPGTPEWGAMLSDARSYMRQAWWMAVFPGVAITLTVLAINLLGDALRDVLDPRLRR